MILKSTYDAINNPWEEFTDRIIKKIPPRWNRDENITIKDVVMWEQVYHQPGNIGIYVAHSPQEEFYLVVHDLFTDTSAGIKTFYGPNAVDSILNLAKKLDISLSTSWVEQ